MMIPARTITSPNLPNPRGHAPLRKPGSARRTSSLDLIWTDGRYGPIEISGTGRDIYTSRDRQPIEIALHSLSVEVDKNKTIFNIVATPPKESLKRVIGLEAFSPLRSQLDTVFGNESINTTPLYRLLHDVTGSLIVSDWAWASRGTQTLEEKEKRRRNLSNMTGVCSGFRPGSCALQTDGDYCASMAAPVEPLPHPEDPAGWHPLPHFDQVSLRRARRTDVWVEGEHIKVESHFQDSATTTQGHRLAVHEYSLFATIDITTHIILHLEPTAHVLPFPECPSALINVRKLTGVKLDDIPLTVSRDLRKVNGCTHLNDVVKSLVDVPALAAIIKNRKTQ